MSSLCVYRKSNKATMKEEFPDYDTYVNLDRQGFAGIQGMRFEKILIVKGCTEYDKVRLEKHLLAEGVAKGETTMDVVNQGKDLISFAYEELNNNV